MLEQDIVIFENGQNSSAEAEFAVHQFLFDEDDAVSLLARYARYLTLSEFVLFYLSNDKGTGSLRIESVADIYRDTARLDGEYCFWVKHVCAHVSKLSELFIRKLFDYRRIFYYSGICGHKAVDVRPVFVNDGVSCARYDRAGDIRTAAAEGMDAARAVSAVETGDDRALDIFKRLCDQLVGLLRHKVAVDVEDHYLFSIDELETELFSENYSAEIFASGRAVVDGIIDDHFLFDLVENGFHIEVKAEVFDYALESLADLRESRGALSVYFKVVIARIEQVGHLRIARKSLAGSGYDDVSPFGIALYDFRDLIDSARVRHGRAAEFNYFDCHKKIPLIGYFIFFVS